MADISKIKLPNGNEYNIKDAEAYTLGDNCITISANTDLNTIKTVGNYRCTNVATAKSLINCPTDVWFTMRVGLADGASSTWLYQEIIDGNNNWWRRIYPGSYWADWTSTKAKEAFLEWGGKNFSASYGPIDAAMVPELGANRMALYPYDKIDIEYSRDAGATWVDYEAANGTKTALFSELGTGAIVIGKADASHKATGDYQLRVTITTDSTLYTVLNKFVFLVSTSGSQGSWVTIQRALKSDETNFIDVVSKVSIAGWSGYNVVNTPGITTYGNTPSSQNSKIRFIFGCKSGSDTYIGLQIIKIMGFGGVGWTTPNTLAKSGRIYDYDWAKNVTFPAKVTATQFNGNASTASTADLATDVGEASIKIHPQSSNEVNFGGTSNSDTIFMGYRARDSRPIPTKFVFGGSAGVATIQAANFTGNAASASILKHSTALNADTIDSFHPAELAYANATSLSGIGLAGSDGILIWIPYNANYGRQIIFDDTTHTILSRSYNQGTWSAWKDLSDAATVNSHTVNKDVPADAKFTDTTISMSMDNTDTKKLIISLT